MSTWIERIKGYDQVVSERSTWRTSYCDEQRRTQEVRNELIFANNKVIRLEGELDKALDVSTDACAQNIRLTDELEEKKAAFDTAVKALEASIGRENKLALTIREMGATMAHQPLLELPEVEAAIVSEWHGQPAAASQTRMVARAMHRSGIDKDTIIRAVRGNVINVD